MFYVTVFVAFHLDIERPGIGQLLSGLKTVLPGDVSLKFPEYFIIVL